MDSLIGDAVTSHRVHGPHGFEQCLAHPLFHLIGSNRHFRTSDLRLLAWDALRRASPGNMRNACRVYLPTSASTLPDEGSSSTCATTRTGGEDVQTSSFSHRISASQDAGSCSAAFGEQETCMRFQIGRAAGLLFEFRCLRRRAFARGTTGQRVSVHLDYATHFRDSRGITLQIGHFRNRRYDVRVDA